MESYALSPWNIGMKRLFLCFALAVGPAVVVHAEDWPAKPVRIIVPFPPASTPDLFARTLGDQLSSRTGKPFIVENRPGAGGMIGTNAVAKAAPDGYTIGVSITGPLVYNTLLYKHMQYDPFRDLAPITLAVNQPCVLVASAGFGGQNLEEVIAELKRHPGRYNYASLGNGTIAHLAMELIASRTGTQIVQVAYPGSAHAVAALVAGDVQLGCMPPISVMPQISAGKLRAIGVASARRSALMPHMRTLAEQGLPGIEANSWIGVVAPAMTPAGTLARIDQTIVAVLHQPEVIQSLRKELMEAVGNTPEEFAAYMKQELDRWGPLIKASGISLD
jgi:tripartite-type tricarboxylate transporter receptor subunit TctC